jgi:predicted 3-demethylubiquinone-9 3-methyltransferase (glyoxalase superfamily)
MKGKGKRATRAPRIAVNGITPFLWFDDTAEEATLLYISIFKNSRIHSVSRTESAGSGGRGSVQSVSFQVAGQELVAFNGGPVFKFTPAVSMFVSCTTQKQVDSVWDRLTRGGKESRCGWLVDRFGLSWQIIPERLLELLGDPDAERSGRALDAMMKMQKIDIHALERAVRGK